MVSLTPAVAAEPQDAPWGLIGMETETGAIDLLWQAPLSGTPDGYNVYRAEGTSEFSLLASTVVVGFTDDSRDANTTTLYRYIVTAVFGDEESAPTNEVWSTYPYCNPIFITLSLPIVHLHPTWEECLFPLPVGEMIELLEQKVVWVPAIAPVGVR
jgi:hypothetical protein